MGKFSILLIALFLFKNTSNYLHAQDPRRFYGGLKAGLNMAQIDGDGLYGYNRFGYHVGVSTGAQLSTKTEFQTEFVYGIRGSRYNERDGKILAYKLNYLDVPLIFCYKDWFHENDRGAFYKMHFQGGLYLGRLLSSSSIDQAMLNKQFKKNDLGWLIGFTYYTNRHLGFTGRFTQSLIPLTRYTNTLGEEFKMISYFISLGFNYRFN